MTDYLSDDLLKESLPLARKTKRWLATLTDYIFYLAIFMAVNIFFGEKYTTPDGATGYRTTGWPAFGLFAVWWLLLPILEGLTGQTVGKAIFKIKTVKVNGDDASMGNCIVRHLFDFADFAPFFGIVGLLVAGNNPHQQRVGDLVAQTIVIQVEK